VNSNNNIVIPTGWTYFAHRTNTEKWSKNPFELETINIDRLMSVVTERDIHKELEDYGPNHFQCYSSGEGIPFEIRCLICNLPYLRDMDDNLDEKNIMLKEFYYDRRNFGGVGGQRHHSIPKGEELIVLGIGEIDEVFGREKKIIWTIPRRLLELYGKDIKKNGYRIISLAKTENLIQSENIPKK